MAEQQQQESLETAGPSKPVPRASIPVTVSEEPVYWAIMSEGADGIQAWGILCVLNIQAKKQRRGRFAEPLGSLANRLGVSIKQIQRAAEIIEGACNGCETEPWIKMIPGSEGGGLLLDVFLEWNPPRGGFREGAGRPKIIKRNQTGQLDYSLITDSVIKKNQVIPKANHSVSVSDSVSSSETDSDIRNAQVSESEGVGARLGARPESGSGIQPSAFLDSGSTERRKGLNRWATATVRLIGLFHDDHGQPRKSPPNGPQGLADQTSIKSLFDEYVWPVELMDDEGAERLDTGLRFVALSAKNGRIPMAYLTNLVKKHIEEPMVVFE